MAELLDELPPDHVDRAPTARAEAIEEIISRPAARSCRCGIHPDMTLDELRALGGGCTKNYICGTLDAIRRRLGQ